MLFICKIYVVIFIVQEKKTKERDVRFLKYEV